MKKVFKATLVAAMVLVSVGASAQLSVNAGYVSTTPKVKMLGVSASGDAISGITAGVGYDLNIQGGLGLAWGLNYTYAWESIKEEGIKMKSTDHYLDIPVRLTYGFPVSDDFTIIGFAGPKFVCAIAGSTKIGDESFDNYGKDSGAARFDIKAGAGAGVQYKNITLKAGYDWGCLNQVKDSESIFGITDMKTRLNQFYVTLGFVF
jgi:Predicted exporter